MSHSISVGCRVVLAGAFYAAFAAGLVGCGQGAKPAAKLEPSGTAKGKDAAVDITLRSAYQTAEAALADEPPRPRVVIRDKREWDLSETAARSLGRIGAAAVPDLTTQLNDRDPLVRKRAADVLARIGPQAERAVPDLILALEDEDESVRKSAALALGQIGPPAADAVPALMKLMSESVAKAPTESAPPR